MSSIVYLIGAGPGDPGLITARGLRHLESADVVLYDHLVHARLLRYARPDAEKLDVGLAAPRPLDQEAICYLLPEKDREGKTVGVSSGAIRLSSTAAVRRRSSFTSKVCASRWYRAFQSESERPRTPAFRSPTRVAATLFALFEGTKTTERRGLT